MTVMRTFLFTPAARWPFVLAALLIAMVWSGAASAGERRELPVTSIALADGSTTELAALAHNRGWLLMVVDAEPNGGRLLTALESWQLGSRGAQVAIVLQGSAADVAAAAAAWQEKLPGLVIATDAKGVARRALGVKAIPTVIGARGTFVEWQIAGVLNDPEVLRQVVISWLADERPVP